MDNRKSTLDEIMNKNGSKDRLLSRTYILGALLILVITIHAATSKPVEGVSSRVAPTPTTSVISTPQTR